MTTSPASLAPVTLECADPHRPTGSVQRRELVLVLGLSVLLHAGVAAAVGTRKDEPRARRLSRIEIQAVRPPSRPLPPPPAAVPPPPKVAAPEHRARAQEKSAPPPPAPLERPVDTGSSLPSAEDGELFAGHGGLGTAAPAPPPPPEVKPAPPPAPLPVVQAHEGANYLKNPRPAYPAYARRQGYEGTTLLRVEVTPSGRPGAVRVQHSSGYDVLDDAAVESVKGWTFVPATQGGTPLGGWVVVPIVFHLQ